MEFVFWGAHPSPSLWHCPWQGGGCWWNSSFWGAHLPPSSIVNGWELEFVFFGAHHPVPPTASPSTLHCRLCNGTLFCLPRRVHEHIALHRPKKVQHADSAREEEMGGRHQGPKIEKKSKFFQVFKKPRKLQCVLQKKFRNFFKFSKNLENCDVF